MNRTAALVLILVICTAFYPLFGGRFFGVSDMRDVYIPLETFFRQELLQGRLPAWNPDAAWGFPVIAAAQIGFFYPPLLLLRFLPTPVYLSLLFLLHFIAAAIGTYLFLRRIGRSSYAAFLGSLSFALGGYLVQHTTHLNIIFAAAWLPWQLLVVEHIAASKHLRPRHFAMLTFLLGIPFLAGQLQIPFYIALLSASYLLYRRLQRHGRKALLPTNALILLVALGSAGLAAAQLLPTWELAQLSSRSPGGDFDIVRANQFSYPPYHLPAVIFPRFFGNDSIYWGKPLEIEYGFYLGTLPLLAAAWIVIKRRAPVFWTVATGVSFFLALGSLSPLRLINLEPSLWIFSAPARWLLLTTFSLSILAAFGIDHAVTHRRAFARFAVRIAIGITATVALVTLILFAIPENRLATASSYLTSQLPLSLNRPTAYYEEKISQLFASARTSSASLASPYTALALITAASLPLLWQRRHGRQLAAALTAAELIIFAATTTPTFPWSTTLSAPATISALPEVARAKQARIYSVREPWDTGAYLTNPASRPKPDDRERERQLLVPLVHTQFNLAGVEWPASLDLKEHQTLLAQLRTENGMINSEAAADLNIGAIIATKASPVQPNAYKSKSVVGDAIVYEIDAKPRAEVIGDPDAKIAYQSVQPAQIQIDVETQKGGLLLIRDTWFPGWKATVNDQPTPIERADGAFRSIKLAAGQHEVQLRYQPRTIYLGIAISSAMFAVCLSSLAYRSRKKRHFDGKATAAYG